MKIMTYLSLNLALMSGSERGAYGGFLVEATLATARGTDPSAPVEQVSVPLLLYRMKQ